MLRALLFWPVVFFSTVYTALVVILIGMFKRHSRFSYQRVVRPWARAIMWASGARVEVEGLENIRPGDSYIIVSNHQGNMDIPLLIAELPIPMTIIAKTELFRIPLFGQGMRAVGILEIDRSNRQQSFATLRRAAEIIRSEQIAILAFPEGTRSESGRLKPFKKGPFVLAIQSQIPLLPVSVSGTFPMMPKHTLKIQPGPVKLVVHPPVPVCDYPFEQRSALVDKIHHTIAAGLPEHER